MRHVLFDLKLPTLLLIGLFCCIAGRAQIQELEPSKTNWVTLGEIKWLANTKASLKYFEKNGDSTFLLYMQDDQKLKNSRDMLVTQHFSIRFSGKGNTAGKLYDLLNSFFTAENRKNKKLEKIFTLGDEMVHVQH